MLVLFDGDLGVRDTFRFIEEKANVGIWSWDLIENRIDWSQGMFNLFDLDPTTTKISHDLIDAMVYPDDRRRPGEVERLMETGVGFDRQFRIIRKDGRIRWLDSRGDTIFDRDGRAIRVIGLVMDITEKRASLETARMTEDRYAAVIAATGARIWIIRPDGQVIDRPGWRNLPGGEWSRYFAYSWRDSIHPDDLDSLQTAINDAIRAKIPFEHEHRARDADGEYRWKRVRGAPALDEHGNLREYVALTLDIQGGQTIPDVCSGSRRISGAQIRAGRSIARWSVQELSDVSGISPAVIRRLEGHDGMSFDSDADMAKIYNALSDAGVQFLFHPGAKPAVAPK